MERTRSPSRRVDLRPRIEASRQRIQITEERIRQSRDLVRWLHTSSSPAWFEKAEAQASAKGGAFAPPGPGEGAP